MARFTQPSSGGSGEPGPTGPQGPQGPAGETGADFGIYYLGNYNSSNGYVTDIAVVRGSDGQLYLAKASGQLGDPINYQINGQWEVWIPKGTDGAQGPQGDQGPQGEQGIQGATGPQGDPGVSGTTAVLAHQVKAGEALTKGQAVYVSSADGTNMIVSKASNTLESTSSKTMGLITTSLANNGQGTLLTEGLLAGLNTATANAGDPVWLGTDGNLIYGLANKPSAPAHLVFIGIVTRANANNGEIFVKCQNGFEVKELHDAVIEANGSVTDNEVFAYDSASGMWKNQTAVEAGLQALEDTGWQTVSTFANNFTGTNVSYRKINNIVYLRGHISGGTAGTGAFTLPLGYRSGIEGVYVAQQYGTANMMYVTIGADGVVAPQTTSAWLSGISYPVG